jgi:TonB family protein
VKYSRNRIFTFGLSFRQLIKNLTMNLSFRHFLYSIAISFFSFAISAQTPILEAARVAEVEPLWPGCTADVKDCSRNKMLEFIETNLQTPAEAKAQGAGGVVLVEFVVEKNGSIGEVHTLRDPGLGLGTEAERVVSLMKEKKIKWSPAEEKGKRIPFRFIIPVSFNLSRPAEVAEVAPITEVDMPEVFEVAEVMPKYSGCVNDQNDTIDCTFRHVLEHIKTNLTYPDSAKAAGAEGPVVVEFIIDASGSITKPVITKSLGYGCDEEALRVISLMPAWQPGMQGGKPVAVKMVVPVMFQISKPNQE